MMTPFQDVPIRDVRSHSHSQWQHNGRPRYQCRGCGRFFGDTEGTLMYRLHIPAAEVAQALLVVMRRGSLRAAEEITGHKYKTIGEWLRRASGDVHRRMHARPCVVTWCSDGGLGYAAILRRAYRQLVRSGQRGRPPLVIPADVRLTQTNKHCDEHGKLLRRDGARWFPNPLLSILNGSTAPCAIDSMP